jgi:hypothetical protein
MRYNLGRSPFPRRDCTTREIDLATAISEIKQAREQTEDAGSPYLIGGRRDSEAIFPDVRNCPRVQTEMKST